MADKVISASLKLDTSGATPAMKEFGKATDDAGKSLDKTNDEAKETGGTFGNLKDGLSKLPGPLKGVTGGIESVNTSLKALAANPIVLIIVAIVAALVALYKAFASTEEGAEKIEQVMKGLGAVITVIRDRILSFGKAIIDFFKGDFKGAIDNASAAVSGFGDAVVDAYTRAADATRRLQEAEDDLNRRINVNRAELNRDLAKSKELISDTTASYQDRIKAVNEVQAAQERQAADELANAKEMLAIKEENANLDKKSSEAQDELAQARINLANVEQQAAADERAINKQRTAIEKEEQDKRLANRKEHDAAIKQLDDEKAAREKEQFESNLRAVKFNQEVIDAGIEERQKKAKEQAEQDKKDQDEITKYQDDINAKEWANVQKDIKIKKDAAEAEKKIEQGKLAVRQTIFQTTSNLLGSLANLIGKQTAAGKALAIAQTTIDTYQSAISSYKSLSGIPYIGPILGAAAAAAAIANGLATIKQIVSVKVPGGADVPITTPTAPSLQSPAAPIAPQQAGTAIDQNSIAGIGNAAVGRTYVLEQDVTRDQNRSERLNRAARLGG